MVYFMYADRASIREFGGGINDFSPICKSGRSEITMIIDEIIFQETGRRGIEFIKGPNGRSNSFPIPTIRRQVANTRIQNNT